MKPLRPGKAPCAAGAAASTRAATAATESQERVTLAKNRGRRRSCAPSRSALDAVVHVCHAGLAPEDARALELDLLGTEVVEETAPLAEEHRDHMELQLVEHAGRERQLGDSGAVYQHFLLA